MTLPEFLKPVTTIKIPIRRQAPSPTFHTAPPIGGAPATATLDVLPFQILPQEKGNWCWAAVGLSIARFYDASVTMAQCDLVNDALGRTDCCADPAASDPGRCNVPWYLEGVLKITGNHIRIERRSLAFAEFRNEIASKRPVGCRVRWRGTNDGHFLVLRGWTIGATGIEYLEVSDPIYLDRSVPFASFATTYVGGASWTHSYWTDFAPAAGGSMAAPPPAISHPEAIGA